MNVHFDPDRTNFYNTDTGAGMGLAFFRANYLDRATFPQLRSGIIPIPQPAITQRWQTGPTGRGNFNYKLPPFPKRKGMWARAPKGNGSLLAAIMPSQVRKTMGQGSISRVARMKVAR